MFFLCHDTDSTSLKPEWVDGNGDSNGDFVESRVRFGPHVNVLLPAAILVRRVIIQCAVRYALEMVWIALDWTLQTTFTQSLRLRIADLPSARLLSASSRFPTVQGYV